MTKKILIPLLVSFSNSPEALDKMTSKSVLMKDRCVGIIPGDNDSVARSKVGDHSAATVCRGFRSHPDKKYCKTVNSRVS